MHRGYRFRLYPTKAQAETLGQWLGVTRLVYNLALEQRRDFWRQHIAETGKRLSFAQQSREVTDLRREFDFIAAVPRSLLEYALRDLDKAFGAFLAGRNGCPTWRKVGLHDSGRMQGREVRVERVNAKWATAKLPNLGAVRFRQSRPIIGEVMNVTVSRQNDAWFIVFASDIGDAAPMNSQPAVGIDRGVATTLSLSTGDHVRLPDMSALEARRRRAQRILSRRKRGSARYNTQRKRLAALSAKIARVRSHHLHVASTDIATRFGVVALEDLNIRAMTASAAGRAPAPSKKVANKRGLNRSILAQGWGIFERMLDYKLEAAGGRLVFVPAAYTSQTCAECGVVDARSRKSQAVFECVACGHRDHADTNAAKNIMRGSTAFVEKGHVRPFDEARTLAA